MKKHAFEIYNASAGSGKTYTLVKEYLKIILSSKRDDAYKNILAITFTNKAVEEMKSRIVSALKAFSKDIPDEKSNSMLLEIARETELEPKEIQEKSRRIIKNII
ncbi:MAG: UvrD-helicase domain-containing protein, partial [Flavobacteriaceae bacterium]